MRRYFISRWRWLSYPQVRPVQPEDCAGHQSIGTMDKPRCSFFEEYIQVLLSFIIHVVGNIPDTKYMCGFMQTTPRNVP